MVIVMVDTIYIYIIYIIVLPRTPMSTAECSAMHGGLQISKVPGIVPLLPVTEFLFCLNFTENQLRIY